MFIRDSDIHSHNFIIFIVKMYLFAKFLIERIPILSVCRYQITKGILRLHPNLQYVLMTVKNLLPNRYCSTFCEYVSK